MPKNLELALRIKADLAESRPQRMLMLVDKKQLADAHQALMQSLADELLAQVRAASPTFFEQLVVDLMIAMGYGGSRKEAGRATQATGDDGIDGIIKEDKLGLDVIYLQAKRWANTVHRPETSVRLHASGPGRVSLSLPRTFQRVPVKRR